MNCCEKCKIRIWYAKRLDIHFWGDDCFYECEKYEREKAENALKVREKE